MASVCVHPVPHIQNRICFQPRSCQEHSTGCWACPCHNWRSKPPGLQRWCSWKIFSSVWNQAATFVGFTAFAQTVSRDKIHCGDIRPVLHHEVACLVMTKFGECQFLDFDNLHGIFGKTGHCEREPMVGHCKDKVNQCMHLVIVQVTFYNICFGSCVVTLEMVP